MAISPLFPACCRFTPTCSQYALIAFRKYGFLKGFVLTAKRILRCRPGGPHGYDPVP
ncbi:MAG: membrane protein insertion efficiency factor YidD [Coriobacteriaceae bacterium]|nr:membrane protein insertion efficiency factor YidD [Coriobacteriaceae bacterium]